MFHISRTAKEDVNEGDVIPNRPAQKLMGEVPMPTHKACYREDDATTALFQPRLNFSLDQAKDDGEDHEHDGRPRR